MKRRTWMHLAAGAVACALAPVFAPGAAAQTVKPVVLRFVADTR